MKVITLIDPPTEVFLYADDIISFVLPYRVYPGIIAQFGQGYVFIDLDDDPLAPITLQKDGLCSFTLNAADFEEFPTELTLRLNFTNGDYITHRLTVRKTNG